MKTRKKQRLFAILALAVVVLGGQHSMATAGPGGSLKGKVVIEGNEAQKVLNKAGSSGGGSILGLAGGGGGKGVRDASTVVQGVDAVGTEINADIAILNNKASQVTNDGARLNVQGISVRR